MIILLLAIVKFGLTLFARVGLFKSAAMKIHPYFDAEEFLHPAVIKSIGFPAALWYMGDFMLPCALLLRNILGGPVNLNDWQWGGRLVGRGFRPRSYKPNGGGEFSQHYLARALDVSSLRYTPTQIFELILHHRVEFQALGVTTLEHLDFTPTWVHLDCRPKVKGIHPENGDFMIVKPEKKMTGLIM